MKKILRHSFHITRWTFACAILISALLLLTARMFSSYIEDYASDIVDRLSIVLGVPVEVDSVSTKWHGLGPYVFMKGIRLGEGENLSSISSVIVKPDVVSSLLAWGIVWSRFEVSEMNAHFQEMPSGGWAFAGIELDGGGGGGYLEEMILESNRVSVQEAKIRTRSLLGSELEFNVHDMRLDYALGFRRLKLEADLGEANKLEFIAELTGTGSRFLDLDGLAYLKMDGHDVSDLYDNIQDKFWPQIDLTISDVPSAEVELWANFRAGKQIEFQGSALLGKIPAQLLGYESGAPSFLADLTGVYAPQSQLFNVQNVEIELYSDTIELPDLRVQRSLGKTEVNYSLTLPSVQVSELLESLSSLPIFANSGFAKLSNDLNPTGEIGPIYLDVPNWDFNRWQLSGLINSVDIDSYRNAPAVKNISGQFAMDASQGTIQIDATNLSVFYPGVYEHWLEHESIQGVVSWQIDFDSQQLVVFADSLSVMDDYGSVKGGFRADVPLQAGHPTGVDLTLFIGINDSSAEHKDNLVPTSLQQSLRNWLDESIVAAQVPQAGFIYRGSTKAGQSKRRTVQLRLQTKDGELRYLDRWPEVTQVNGQVWVSDGRVMGSAESAQLLDIQLSDIAVSVETLTKNGKKTNQLDLSAFAEGPSTSFLDLVRTTSLRDQVGDSLDILGINGDAQVSINLSLPTDKNIQREDIDIQVQAELFDNQLAIAEQNLQLDSIKGVLNYDNKGLHANGVRAELWGRSLKLDLAENQQQKFLGIDARGRVDVKSVADWLSLDFLQRFQGVTEVNSRIEIATGLKNKTDDRYHFWTDMVGVASEFPEPFNKTADKNAPLDIRVELGELIVTSIGWDLDIADFDIADLEISDKADATDKSEVEIQGIQPDPAELLIEISQYPKDSDDVGNSGNAEGSGFHSVRLGFLSPLPESQQGFFTGQIKLADFNIEESMEAYKAELLSWSPENSISGSDDKNDSVGSVGYGTILGLEPDISFEVGTLSYGDTNFGEVTAKLLSEPTAWRLDLEADYASASLYWFEEQQLPLVNIATLDLDQAQTIFSPDKEEGDGDLLDPSDLPEVAVKADSIILDGSERGSWSGTFTSTENGLWIGDLRGGLNSAQLADEEGGSTVFWGLRPEGYYTELDLTFEYGDIGDLFKLIEVEPPMDSKEGIFYASLNWDGAPYEFSESEVSGIMGIEARNGSFHTGGSNVPNALLKTIGLINVGSWVRRLRLDFNDMTASGTPYDLIFGDFIVGGDQISTLTPVDVELSSGSMLFDGVIDLSKEEVDARLVVTLPARQNVTWIAALVAGLPAAAGVWLAGKVFDDELDSLSSVSYKVSGSLDDPKVSAEKMFESTITK